MTGTQNTKKTPSDYLNGLVWDQKPRLARWIVDYAGAADTESVRTISRNTLITAVRRARQPGCKLDEMLVLEGSQGCGKSSALRILAGDWYTDDLPIGSSTRQVIEATAGKWIVEAAELRAMGEGDIAVLKAFLACSSDEARMPYQVASTRVPRAFVIIGTTHETNWMHDVTGNRRFWPVHVAHFDLDRLRADRDQLWAEASAAEVVNEPIGMAVRP